MKRWIILTLAAIALSVFSIVMFAQKSATSKRARASLSTAKTIEGDGATANLNGPRTPVIVELFTSEGCSSCPPADELLARLEKTQPVAGAEIIALGQHVDYWNRLGWVDPFSSAAFSQRQGDYAEAFGHDGVYTPQMIVDGQTEFSGGNQAKARDAIMRAAQTPKAIVELTRAANFDLKSASVPLSVRVEKLPAVRANDAAEVLLAVTESNLRSDVSRGENAGRTLSHTAVVRQLSVLGTAQTGAAFTANPTLTIESGWQRKNLRAVVFVQERESKRVLGASAIKLVE